MKGTFCFINGKTKTKSTSLTRLPRSIGSSVLLSHTQAQVAGLGAARTGRDVGEAVKGQRGRRRSEASAQVHADAGGLEQSGPCRSSFSWNSFPSPAPQRPSPPAPPPAPAGPARRAHLCPGLPLCPPAWLSAPPLDVVPVVSRYFPLSALFPCLQPQGLAFPTPTQPLPVPKALWRARLAPDVQIWLRRPRRALRWGTRTSPHLDPFVPSTWPSGPRPSPGCRRR